jgi:hypothetical protein
VIIACNRAHPAQGALQFSDGSSTHVCALEATRTQAAPQLKIKIDKLETEMENGQTSYLIFFRQHRNSP